MTKLVAFLAIEDALEIWCFVKTQNLMLKLHHNFHGPFRVYKVTGTNAKIN